MIGNRNRLAPVRRTPDAPTDPKQSMEPGRDRSGASNPARVGPVVAATLLLFALALQCFDLRAELQFRSAERKDGQQHWSALKNYTNPADTAYPRTLADGTQVPAEEVQVFLNGFITIEDVNSAKVMENLLKKGRQKIAGNIVSFASNGGEVDAAMELGRLLRKLGVSTLVARDEQCMSSCVFAFMGGDQRTAAGRIGIHRPYFSSSREVADRRILYRQLQKKLQEYIEELDFPRSLYEAVMAVPPDTVSVVAPADLKRFYLEGMSPSTQDEVDAASARALGISVLEYFERKTAGKISVADAPARQQKDPPGAHAAGSVAGQTKAETEGLGASRSIAGSPRASF
jgi:ATP-dependent protease ClpP protease subunit